MVDMTSKYEWKTITQCFVVVNEKKTYRPVRLQSGKTIWRNYHRVIKRPDVKSLLDFLQENITKTNALMEHLNG